MKTWTLALPNAQISPISPCSIDSDRPCLISAERAEAILLEGNPLSDCGVSLPTAISTPALIVRSGLIETDSDDETDKMDAARRTWSQEGRDRFDAAWADLSAQAESQSIGLWVHPVAGDVLGDIPALRGLAAGSPKADIFLEPAALITPSMVDTAEDHFVRMLDGLVESGVVRAVAMTNIAGTGTERARTPIDDGEIDPAVLRAFAEKFAALGPVCVLPQDAGVPA